MDFRYRTECAVDAVGEGVIMLTWATVLFVVSLVAEAVGFAGLALVAGILAKSLAASLVVLLTILFFAGPSSVDTVLGRFSRPILT